jgi:hypothetical protein
VFSTSLGHPPPGFAQLLDSGADPLMSELGARTVLAGWVKV